jgi:hypothetical protein
MTTATGDNPIAVNKILLLLFIIITDVRRIQTTKERIVNIYHEGTTGIQKKLISSLLSCNYESGLRYRQLKVNSTSHRLFPFIVSQTLTLWDDLCYSLSVGVCVMLFKLSLKFCCFHAGRNHTVLLGVI